VQIDGQITAAETSMLARVAAGLAIGADAGSLRRELTSITPPSGLTRIDDAVARERAATDEIARAAAFGAVLATTSLPIAAEPCLFTNHVRLARNIGLLFGHEVDDTFWRTFTQNVIGAAASRQAVSWLLELIPSSSRTANAAYASTYALGQVTYLYFAQAEAMSAAAIRDTFLQARKVGQSAAVGASSAIAAHRVRLQRPKAVLDIRLELGALTETAYANELAQMA
jgi:uncharacterized protein (DUF697 family)